MIFKLKSMKTFFWKFLFSTKKKVFTVEKVFIKTLDKY